MLATVASLLLALMGLGWRGVELAAVCWAVYGLGFAALAFVERGVDALPRFLHGGGHRSTGEFSDIETLVVRGRLVDAADALLERGRIPEHRVAAALRRAALLGGPLGNPEAAVQALLDLRTVALGREVDLRVGLALVDLYEQELHDPGRAMAELRRLLDRHPDAPTQRRLRLHLADLRQHHFSAPDQTGARTPP
ncbi:MAG TPA: hypothetical protein VK012_03145 [Gemmatimonadales bacterium]|nr:hypothetical protein [Gemmatimonadales bacterium]